MTQLQTINHFHLTTTHYTYSRLAHFVSYSPLT